MNHIGMVVVQFHVEIGCSLWAIWLLRARSGSFLWSDHESPTL